MSFAPVSAWEEPSYHATLQNRRLNLRIQIGSADERASVRWYDEWVKEKLSAAFKDPLRPHQEHAGKTAKDALLQVGDNPDFVVREYRLEPARTSDGILLRGKKAGSVLLDRGGTNPIRLPAGMRSLPDIATEANRLCRELKEKYKIDNRAVFVVAPNISSSVVAKRFEEGKKTSPRARSLYALSENIQAIPEAKLGEGGQKARYEAYYNLWGKLLDYYEDKFRSQENFLGDIYHSDQYEYGEKISDVRIRENSEHIYLVDIEPRIANGNRNLLFAVKHLYDAELAVENHPYGDAINFRPLRERAKNLFRTIRSVSSAEDHDGVEIQEEIEGL